MSLFECWNRIKEGLNKTANIIAITILGVASALTVDWVLLCMGTALEFVYLIGYLCFPSLWTRHRALSEGRARAQSGSNVEVLVRGPFKHLTRALLAAPGTSGVKFLDGVLLVVTVIGFVVILFFGFGKHLLSHPWPYLTHAEGWDAGAIIWTWAFLLYYMVKFRSTDNPAVDSFIKVLISVVSSGLLVLAWKSMDRPTEHVVYVGLIAVCFLVVDSLIVRFHPSPKEQYLSRASRKWADWPMVIAFVVLFLYLIAHPDTEAPEVFVSGVVSCQLLISNAVFVVMEFGLLRPGRDPSVPPLVDSSTPPEILPPPTPA